MRRVEILTEASRRFGRPVPYWLLRRAHAVGAVSEPERIGGWRRYSESHLEELLTYLKTRSRVGVFMSQAAEANA